MRRIAEMLVEMSNRIIAQKECKYGLPEGHRFSLGKEVTENWDSVVIDYPSKRNPTIVFYIERKPFSSYFNKPARFKPRAVILNFARSCALISMLIKDFDSFCLSDNILIDFFSQRTGSNLFGTYQKIPLSVFDEIDFKDPEDRFSSFVCVLCSSNEYLQKFDFFSRFGIMKTRMRYLMNNESSFSVQKMLSNSMKQDPIKRIKTALVFGMVTDDQFSGIVFMRNENMTCEDMQAFSSLLKFISRATKDDVYEADEDKWEWDLLSITDDVWKPFKNRFGIANIVPRFWMEKGCARRFASISKGLTKQEIAEMIPSLIETLVLLPEKDFIGVQNLFSGKDKSVFLFDNEYFLFKKTLLLGESILDVLEKSEYQDHEVKRSDMSKAKAFISRSVKNVAARNESPMTALSSYIKLMLTESAIKSDSVSRAEHLTLAEQFSSNAPFSQKNRSGDEQSRELREARTVAIINMLLRSRSADQVFLLLSAAIRFHEENREEPTLDFEEWEKISSICPEDEIPVYEWAYQAVRISEHAEEQ